MSFFSRFKTLMKQEPEEQIAGYSICDLKTIFTASSPETTAPLFEYPKVMSLRQLGISAFYISFLIDSKDTLNFLTLINLTFRYQSEKTFNDLPAKHYVNDKKNEHLVFFTSTREFNGTTVRMVTNSTDFMDEIFRAKFAPPPPWVAFEGYKPSWWGGDMQGAQGYYDDNYFRPFFTRLSDSEKQTYYTRFEATDEWIKNLELMYSND
ncbi:hypothetical protein [Pseudomonas sp. NPDC086278]|uniref:hypothetical protein n=1 Tax=Pseudomonas sp. NPDC086278 TaxID=3390646 RepID=UPI003D03354C